MSKLKQHISILVLPLLLIAWSIFLLFYFDSFSSRAIDPEYPYLINGLNCALLKFNRIGHFDHPGTPLQLFCGLTIRIVHVFAGKGAIAVDVISRPDFYLNSIMLAGATLTAVLNYLIGFFGIKRGLKMLYIFILQAGVFYNDVLLMVVNRVNSEMFFMLVTALFVLGYILFGFKNQAPKKFAVWSGVVMAMGFAAKFNYMPLLFLPILFIKNKHNLFLYFGTVIVSFFVFVLPVIDKFDDYWRFIKSILLHDGQYGAGENRIFNIDNMVENVMNIFRFNPELFLLIVLMIVSAIFLIYNRQYRQNKPRLVFLIGSVLIISVQILMTIKHFKNHYLAPVFTVYAFLLFQILMFFEGRIRKPKVVKIVAFVLPLVFIFSTGSKLVESFSYIDESKLHRADIQGYVANDLDGNDWLLIEPTWKGSPFVENALIYGMSYSAHRDKYFNELMQKNSKVITYEGDEVPMKLWRIHEISFDSLLTEGNSFVLHSSPERKTATIIDNLSSRAQMHGVVLHVDTLYYNHFLNEAILRVR